MTFVAACWMFAFALASNTCSQATNMDYFIPWGLSLAGEGTELIILENLRMCQEVFDFWRLKSEGLTLGNWFLEKKTNFFGCYFKPSCQFIELKGMETGKDIIEKWNQRVSRNFLPPSPNSLPIYRSTNKECQQTESPKLVICKNAPLSCVQIAGEQFGRSETKHFCILPASGTRLFTHLHR